MKTVFERVNHVQMQKKFSDMKCLTIEWITCTYWKERNKKTVENNLRLDRKKKVWNIRNKRNMKADRIQLQDRENKTTASSG